MRILRPGNPPSAMTIGAVKPGLSAMVVPWWQRSEVPFELRLGCLLRCECVSEGLTGYSVGS
jgi:hypothetical protein